MNTTLQPVSAKDGYLTAFNDLEADFAAEEDDAERRARMDAVIAERAKK